MGREHGGLRAVSMAIDESLNERFRKATAKLEGMSETKMMGGTCFMLKGNMLGGADQPKQGPARFMFRVGKDSQADALSRDGAIPFEPGGRRMGGIVFVDASLCDTPALNSWIKLALSFVGTLKPK